MDLGGGGSSASSSSSSPSKPDEPKPNNDKRNKKAPQELIDEFWAKFTTKKPGKVTTVMPPFNPYTDIVEKKSSKPAITSAQASYEEAAAMCRAKVEKIVKECRRINKKYRDPHFDIEWDLKSTRNDFLQSLNNDANADEEHSHWGCNFTPESVKRVEDIFDEPQFYIEGPTASDVKQGRDGDCWLMAALCMLSNKPGLIEKLCVAHDQAVGVYGFVFHRDGEWISEIVDDFLYLIKPDYDESLWDRILFDDVDRVDPEAAYRKLYQSNSSALYFAQCAHPQETWLPLLEKCYAKAHGDFACIEGGWEGEAIEDLTGGVTSEVWVKDILDKDRFWKEELLKVNDQFLFGCSTGLWGRGWGARKGIVESHAYSVQKAVEIDGKRLMKLKNPWGKYEWTGPWSDGSKEWTPEWMQKLDHRFGDDGDFWIEYKDFLRKYEAFDRTRLLGPEWRVTQAWTTVSVPWTLDYHDTHFAFSLAKSGPVVIVLAQLDSRYFRGLEGQYRYKLSFRVHKAGQQDYVVRSQTPLAMTRSVNVDLDLDAGEYEVLVKIDASRDKDVLPIEDVVRKNARERRDKLTRIGLAYDLAHSKGKVNETAEEKAAKEEREKRLKKKAKVDIKKKLVEKREESYYLATKDRKRDQRRQARAIAKSQRKKAERKAKKEAKKAEREAKDAQEAKEAQEAQEAQESKAAQKAKETTEETKQGESVDTAKPEEASGEVKKADIIVPTVTFKEGEDKDAPIATPESDDKAASEPKEESKEEPKVEKTPSSNEGEQKKPEEEEEEEDDEVDALSDISDLSELSERDLDIRAEALFAEQETTAASSTPDGDEEPDEFEKDPWNAVATISLRVYHKTEDADSTDSDDTIVDLKVVRPNPYLDDEDEEAKEPSAKDCNTKGLDVDDSAKDATLKGPVRERKKSILGGGRTSRVM